MKYLHQISVENFLSLKDVTVELDELSVLVGPNGAGKTNFLEVIQFLGDTARLDLGPAIAGRGGFESLLFRGRHKGQRRRIQLGIKAQVTRFSSDAATDDYTLSFWQRGRILEREENFKFKRTQGKGRRITVNGAKVEIQDDGLKTRSRDLADTSAALSTLRRLGKADGAEQVEDIATLFEAFRVFEVDVAAARLPAPVGLDASPMLESNASNLAEFLRWLHETQEDRFALLEDDLRYVLPGFRSLHFEPVGGSATAVAVSLEEQGLSGRTPLAAASFGTVRALALLAMLHDPSPPKLTCVEEVDHGLHPYALDRIVERLRDAKKRTQLLIATHSPALVNRLDPSELIVCERDATTGATLLPAVDPTTIAEMRDASDLSLGELWFSGALGGVP